MHPEIFHIGLVTIKAYGLALALSFFLGIILTTRRSRKFGIDANRVIDLSLVILVAAVAGSRFFYVIYHLEEFEGHYSDILNPFQSSGEIGIAGLSMMGGFVLVIISSMFFIKLWKMPFWETLDAFAPAFLLGLGISRIGCFLNGCCYGDPTDWSWGIVFPQDCAAGWHFPGIPLYPAQLMSSAGGFILFGVLLWLERRQRFAGFSFFMMGALYSALRFTIDFFRYYEPSMVFANIGGIDFSNNQALTFLIFLISVTMLILIPKLRSRRERRETRAM
ncbi:MAG: prolipoprotein diacylglyceryl transferase [candidate division Zixibacteria bacterium CG_4_9_14_3_um_filter_46_8]|nr:MAG: prolipoprotein diacylglyceryl transferase [candidate division Zixibacteria bacterium CG_4_9_14_3_um_filter_46_8]